MQIKLTVQQAIDLTGEIYKQMARQMQPPILPIVLDLPDDALVDDAPGLTDGAVEVAGAGTIFDDDD